MGLLLETAAWATILARFLLLLRFGSDLFLGVEPHFRHELHPAFFSDARTRAFPLICLVSTPNLLLQRLNRMAHPI
jgi:hypothetical protein